MTVQVSVSSPDDDGDVGDTAFNFFRSETKNYESSRLALTIYASGWSRFISRRTYRYLVICIPNFPILITAIKTMNYVEWCERVLTKLDALSESQEYVRNHDIDVERLEKHIWGERYGKTKSVLREKEYRYVTDDAIFDFKKIGLIEDGTNMFRKPTLNGRAAAKDLFGLWELISRTGSLPKAHRLTLETINRLSEKIDEEFARVEMVEEYEIRRELRELDHSFASLKFGLLPATPQPHASHSIKSI